MSLVDSQRGASPSTHAELVALQLHALDRWNLARQVRDQELTAAQPSREAQLDAVRRREIFDRAHEAVMSRARMWPAAVRGW